MLCSVMAMMNSQTALTRSVALLDARQDQAGEAGDQHHAGGEPERGVQEFVGNAPYEQDGQRPDGVQQGYDHSADEPVNDRVAPDMADKPLLEYFHVLLPSGVRLFRYATRAP
jgi:hypothetical protein